MPLLLWFRNDLRTHDNPALHYFLSQQSSYHNTQKIKQAVFGSKVTPFPTQVPGLSGS